jgi:hypothetical protein
MSGELSRYERETVVEDAATRFASTRSWLSAKIIAVRIYQRGAATPIADLVTVMMEYP